MNGDIDAPQHEQRIGEASVSAKLLPAPYNGEQMLRVLIGIASQFYPQLRRLYRRRIQEWAIEQARSV